MSLSAGWEEQILSVLHLIYTLLGGNANNLPSDVYLSMAAVTTYYAVHGVPANLTDQQKAEGRAVVEAAWTLTSSPSFSLIVSTFRVTLRSMYVGLGGNPNNLH